MKTKCPECGFKLRNFIYADVCPNCQEVLKHNQVKLTPTKQASGPRPWVIRVFLTTLRFVEN